ncbi:MAG: acyl-CoA dehydrogenase family protein, partial [Mycobacterium sp.]
TQVLLGGVALGLADGPTEAHKVNLARMLLKNYEAESPEWPSEMLDNRLEAAKAKYGAVVDRVPALPDSP